MGNGKCTIAGLLLMSVVLTVQTNEIEDQSDTCVCMVGVEGHNRSELTCEAPEKPLNGGYVSDVGGQRYNTGDPVTYYCNRGHRMIGQANRICNGTANGWTPEPPYCEPEYIDHLMRKLNLIETEIRFIKESIENNTLQMGFNISVMDNTMSTIENNVSVITNKVFGEELFNRQKDLERLAACTGNTTATDEDTVTKCKTMQMGVRNGHSVSVYTWVIHNFYNKMPQSGWDEYYSQPFYHIVPGYKFRLRGNIFDNSDIRIYLQLLPGEYDDQLKWPCSPKHNVTILTNTGLEAPHRTFSGEQSTYQPTSPTHFDFDCYTFDAKWDDVWRNKKHILTDDSVVAKLYFYN